MNSLSFPYVRSDCDRLDGESEDNTNKLSKGNEEVFHDSHSSPDPAALNSSGEESDLNEQQTHVTDRKKEHFYHCPTQVKNYHYRFLITKLYTRVGMIQEAAVTDFLVKLGLPKNVTFRVVKFEVNERNYGECCSKVKIAVHEDTRSHLNSSDCFDLLLDLNRKRFGDTTSEYTSCCDLMDNVINDVYDRLCRLLNTTNERKGFHASHNDKCITILEYRKPTRMLPLCAVLTDYIDEFVTVFQKLDKESQIMLMAETRSVRSTDPHADHDECMRRYATSRFIEGICYYFNENEEIKPDVERRHAVAKTNVIKIHSKGKKATVVQPEHFRQMFPDEFKSFLLELTLGDRIFLLQKWNRALAHRKQQRWATQTVHKNPRKVFEGVVLKGICDMLNADYITCSIIGCHLVVNDANGGLQKRFGIHEAVQRYPDEYVYIVEGCDSTVCEALKQWEVSDRKATRSTEEPSTKKAKF